MTICIDIERLLTWAYREELIKRITSSAEELWEHMRERWVLGTAIDRGVSTGAQRYDLGSPHPDALLIERAVGQLPDQVLDWQSEAHSVLGDLLALVEPRPDDNELVSFCETKVSWPTRSGGRVHRKLDPARRVILVRSLRTNALVTMHASMGSRPDWHSDPPRPTWVPATRGHGAKIVGECRGRGYYTTGSHCPLVWEPSPIEIAEARADYLAWWRGLYVLAELLRGQLTKYYPMYPSAPQRPWQCYGSNEQPAEPVACRA